MGPGGAHSERVRVGCYSAIHVLSAWGAGSSWGSRLLRAICDLVHAASSMRFPSVAHSLASELRCFDLRSFGPPLFAWATSHRRPRIRRAWVGFRSQTTLELPSAPSDMPTDQLLPAHRQLSRRTPWAHRAVAIIHVDFSGGRHRPSAVAGCVKLVSTTGWTGSASAFPTIAALA